MTLLPREEKLPLVTRKNIRDEWEAARPGIEKQLSELLGTSWSVDIDPNVIYPYGDPSCKEQLGYKIKTYVEGAYKRLYDFEELHGQEGIDEINNICYAHTLTLDVDSTAKLESYCGVDVTQGKLRILFQHDQFANNMYGALAPAPLEEGLNTAEPPPGTEMSYSARSNIRLDYDRKIEDSRKKITALLQKEDIVLVPNFLDTYAMLKAESVRKKNQLSRTWQQEIGDVTRKFFDGVAYQLKNQKFGEDELLREGFHDIIDKGTIAFRVVEKLATEGDDCDCVIENGVLYLQCTASTWDANGFSAARKLVDML